MAIAVQFRARIVARVTADPVRVCDSKKKAASGNAAFGVGASADQMGEDEQTATT